MIEGKIYTAIPKMMAEVGAIGKTGTAPGLNYKFRMADDIAAHLQPLLSKHGVFVVPRTRETLVEDLESVDREGNKKISTRTTLTIDFDWIADDGSMITCATVGQAIDYSDKSANKAMTAAWKYAICQTLCIPTAEMKDSEADEVDAGKPVNRQQSKPVSNGPAYTDCPQCGEKALMPSRFKEGELYCNPKAGGCSYKCTSRDLEVASERY